MNNKGFKLVELLGLFTVVIIFFLFLWPKYSFTVERAKVVKVMSFLRLIANAQERYRLENEGRTTTDIADFDIEFPFSAETSDGGYTLEGGLGAIYLYDDDGFYIVWNSGKGYTVDYYGKINSVYKSTGICYRSPGESKKARAEKVCSSFGADTAKETPEGARIYAINL